MKRAKPLELTEGQVLILERCADGLQLSRVRRWIFFRRFPKAVDRDISYCANAGLVTVEDHDKGARATITTTTNGLFALAIAEKLDVL